MSHSSKIIQFSCAVVLILATASCAEKPKTGTVLAKVGNWVITDQDFIARVKSLPKDLRATAMQRKQDFLEDIEAEQFLLKEAERQGIPKQGEVQRLVDAARKKIIVAKLIETEIDGKVSVSEDEMMKYYEARKDEFMTPLLLRASHILVKTSEEANSLKSQINQGADFEELARTYSLDATALRGGDLGFFQKGQFVPEFEEAVFKMTKGDFAGPVKTQFGYHVIKLTDRIEPTLREYRQVKLLIRDRLLNEKRTQLFRSLMEKLKGNAKLEVNEKALEAITLDSPKPSKEEKK